MLPFLKPKAVAGVIIAKRKPDGGTETSHMEGYEDNGLEACAEDMIRAFHAKDAKALAAAFKSAFEMCDAQPHEEGPHIEGSDE